MGPRLGAVLESVWPGLAGVVLVGIALANGSEAPVLSVEEGAGVVSATSASTPLEPAAGAAAAAKAVALDIEARNRGLAVESADEWHYERPSRRPPVRESEGAFRAELQLVAEREGAEALQAAIRAALDGDGVLAQKVAALQVSFASDAAGRLQPFDRVLWGTAPADAVLREFAVRHLARNATNDDDALAVLAKALDSPGLDLGGRWEAMAAVLQWGRGDDVETSARRLLAETNHGAVMHAVRALAGNQDPAAVKWLEELRSGHPDPRVRSRIERTLDQLGRAAEDDG